MKVSAYSFLFESSSEQRSAKLVDLSRFWVSFLGSISLVGTATTTKKNKKQKRKEDGHRGKRNRRNRIRRRGRGPGPPRRCWAAGRPASTARSWCNDRWPDSPTRPAGPAPPPSSNRWGSCPSRSCPCRPPSPPEQQTTRHNVNDSGNNIFVFDFFGPPCSLRCSTVKY